MNWLALMLKALGITEWIARWTDRKADESTGELRQRNADLKAQNDVLRKQRDSLADPVTDEQVSKWFKKGEF